jgi:hypothetical protein
MPTLKGLLPSTSILCLRTTGGSEALGMTKRGLSLPNVRLRVRELAPHFSLMSDLVEGDKSEERDERCWGVDGPHGMQHLLQDLSAETLFCLKNIFLPGAGIVPYKRSE